MEVDYGAPVVASSERTIEAAPQTIWDVLVDVERWPTWNSAVKTARMAGPLAEGTSFRWKASSLMISSVFREVHPPRTLGWSGQTLGIPALHEYKIDLGPQGTVVRSTESWGGLLASLFPRAMRRKLQLSLDFGLECLRAEAERRDAQGDP
jgi:uncharacterized protein YndB with AHSA1/START domain